MRHKDKSNIFNGGFRRDMTSRMTIFSFVAAIAMFSVSICTMPMPAHAETSTEIQAKIDAAKSHRDDLYDQAEQASEALNATQSDIDSITESISSTQEDIDSTNNRIASAKSKLSSDMSSEYKGRGNSFISLILGASSLSELTRNMHYANKLSSETADAIGEISSLEDELSSKKEQLEGDKADNESLLSQQQEQKDELDSEASEADAYVNGLDVDLKEALAKEEADEQAQSVPAAGDVPEIDASVSGWRQTVLSAAYANVGGSYVYGASSWGVCDCSGLTMLCYGEAGISIPHQSESQASFCDKPISEAVPGDVVWKYGHVGIYIGNGRTIEAFNPHRGIRYGYLSSFSRCGSPIE